jgi:hypothetical protein
MIVLGNGRRGAATPPIILNPGEQTAFSARH